MSLRRYRELHLQAHDGSMIRNNIEPDPTENAVALARAGIDKLILANASQVGRPTGRYNCHGLVFASRRTCIPPHDEDVDIEDLLRRDGYHLVKDPRVGDIVAYRDSRNQIEHTGIACRVNSIGSFPVVQVWSMWGGIGEFLHPADQSPYSRKIEYWRLT